MIRLLHRLEFGDRRAECAGQAWASTMSFGLLVVTLLVAASSAIGQQASKEAPDAIFYNGKVITLDSGSSIQQAFAVKGDQFAAVGTTAKVRALVGKNTRLVDLNGAAVIPGLTDNHDHMYAVAKVMRGGVNMVGVATSAQLLERLKPAVAKAKLGEVVYTTAGWSIDALPSLKDLDALTGDVPVYLVRHRRAHGMVNSAALKLAGITRENPTYAGLTVPGDANGNFSGDVPAYPASITLMDNLITPPSPDEEETMLLKAMAERNARGITGIRELALWPGWMRAYYRLWKQGKLTVRVSASVDLPDPAQTISQMKEWGVGPGFGDHWLRIDSDAEEPWPPSTSLSKFTEIAIETNRLGWRLAPHTAADPNRGIPDDETVNDVLQAFEAADRDSSIKDKRWLMEHVPYITPEQMDRAKNLGVILSIQDMGWYGGYNALLKTVGKEQAERETPLREILDHHLTAIAGSDYRGPEYNDPNPSNPFKIFYYFVTRKTSEGRTLDPREKITREEALRLFTVNSAYATFEEKVKGPIQPGMLADFVILNQDLMTVPDEKIRSTLPLATYVGGRKVYSAPGANF
jgi:predicted amidohydrolase YtcJ